MMTSILALDNHTQISRGDVAPQEDAVEEYYDAVEEYYTEKMKRCADAIEKDGLGAKVEIDATDLMILLSKAFMQRYPIVIKEPSTTRIITRTTDRTDICGYVAPIPDWRRFHDCVGMGTDGSVKTE